MKLKILLLILVMIMLIKNVGASQNQPDNRTVGYVYLDSEGNITNKSSAIYLHIWNTKDDYYFNASSGIQFGNHFQEFWTKNIFCGGYKTIFNEWVYKCNDALPFTWNIKNDNETYVNITGYKDQDLGSKTVRFILRYSLYADDSNLTVIPAIENIGTEDINNDLGFAWRVKDIQIANTIENDTIRIWNNSVYDEFNLSDNLHINYTNLNKSKYEMWDNEFLMLAWNKNLNYKLMIESKQNQTNAPTTLAINAGTLDVGQRKQTRMYWIDAKPDPPAWVDNLADTPDPVTVPNAITYSGSGNDPNGDSYYLTVCRTDSINVGTPGTCDSGEDLCTSDLTANLGTATCDYTTQDSDAGTLTAHGFLCDSPSDGCSISTSTTTTVNAYPSFSDLAVNDSDIFTGETVNHSATIGNSPDVYLFSWNGSNGCAGTWENSSVVDVSGASVTGWNISIIESNCAGKNVGWMFFANNSVGWRNSSLQTYDVSSYGALQVNLTLPVNNTNVTQNNTFTINATITCSGAGAKCGTVYANARYNLSVNPDTLINTTDGGSPLFAIGEGDGGDITNVTYESVLFNASESNIPSGLWRDSDGFFWVRDSNPDFIDKYDSTGNLILNFSVSAGGSGLSGNDSLLWTDCTSVENLICEYNHTGTNTKNFTPVAVAPNFINGIAYDGEKLWISHNNEMIYRYAINSSGDWSYDNFNFSVVNQIPTSLDDIDADSTRIWVSDDLATDIVFEYNHSGNYTGFNFTPPTTSIRSIYFDGTYFYGVENTGNDDNVTRYTVTQTGGEADNPQTSPSTLETGEDWNISWTINATGTNNTQYLIDVLFNSSYGNSNVPDNNTVDSLVCIGSCPTEAEGEPPDTTPPYVSIAPENYTTTNTTLGWNITLSEDSNISGTYGTYPSFTDNGTFSNSTLATLFRFNFSGLINNTIYNFNITQMCDATPNCNTTGYNFSFTTTQNPPVVPPPTDTCSCPSPVSEWNVNCLDNCSITSECDITGYNLNINGGVGSFEVLANIKTEQLAVESGCIFNNIPNDGNEVIIG